MPRTDRRHAAALLVAVALPVPAPAQQARHAVDGHFRIPRLKAAVRRHPDRTGNVISNAGFETGYINRGWYQCGDVSGYVTTAHPFSGSYAEYSGVRGGAEPVGNSGVCQRVTVPRGGILTAQLYQLSDEADATYAYQEADLLDDRGDVVVNLYRSVNNRSRWEMGQWNLSAYAGRSFWLYFGVHGDGYPGLATQQFVDEVRLTPSHE